jgi:hypothetical protein
VAVIALKSHALSLLVNLPQPSSSEAEAPWTPSTCIQIYTKVVLAKAKVQVAKEAQSDLKGPLDGGEMGRGAIQFCQRLRCRTHGFAVESVSSRRFSGFAEEGWIVLDGVHLRAVSADEGVKELLGCCEDPCAAGPCVAYQVGHGIIKYEEWAVHERHGQVLDVLAVVLFKVIPETLHQPIYRRSGGAAGIG